MPGVPQSPEEVDLLVQPRVGRGALGTHLPELPQLEQAGGRVVDEVPLRERGEVVQQRVVRGQEREVRRNACGAQRGSPRPRRSILQRYDPRSNRGLGRGWSMGQIAGAG